MPSRERRLFLFVGERPSDRAVRMGVTWTDGALAGATLFDALRNMGVDPSQQSYRNLYTSPVRGASTDSEDERDAVGEIKRAHQLSLTVVGMGRIVQRVLTREGGSAFATETSGCARTREATLSLPHPCT